MDKPEQYILDEWDSICAKAHKAAQSDCPLIEDEVIIAMHKYVSELEARMSVLGGSKVQEMRGEVKC